MTSRLDDIPIVAYQREVAKVVVARDDDLTVRLDGEALPLSSLLPAKLVSTLPPVSKVVSSEPLLL